MLHTSAAAPVTVTVTAPAPVVAKPAKAKTAPAPAPAKAKTTPVVAKPAKAKTAPAPAPAKAKTAPAPAPAKAKTAPAPAPAKAKAAKDARPVVVAFNAGDYDDMKAAIAFARAAKKQGNELRSRIIASATDAFAGPNDLRRAFEPLAVAIMHGHATKWADANEDAPASRFFRHWDSVAKAAAFDTGAQGDARRAIVNPMIALLKRVCHEMGGSPAKAAGAKAPNKGGAIPSKSAPTAGDDDDNGNIAEGKAASAIKRHVASVTLAMQILEGLNPKTAGEKRDIASALAGLRDMLRTLN